MDVHNQNTQQPPIEVPLEMLSEEALKAVLESFILREGTDYGKELTLETKIDNLKRRLARKRAHLIYDPNSESITFISDVEWLRYKPRE